MPSETLNRDSLDSPLGTILLVTDGEGRLRALDFKDYELRMLRLLRAQNPPTDLSVGRAPEAIREALLAYFQGDLEILRSIPWSTGGTPFQRQVWAALSQIPPGETWTYGQVAQLISRASAVRAVGMANGANPVAIVVPCHRVIGRDGTLTGYGGGIARKQWLLHHEGAGRGEETHGDLFAINI